MSQPRPNGRALRDEPAALRVPVVLQRAHSRFYRLSKHDDAGRAVDYHNPLEELIAREEMAEAEALVDALATAQRSLHLDVIPQALVGQIQEIVIDHFRQLENRLLDWLFAASPAPLDVTKRAFAWGKQKRPDLLHGMNFRDLGDLFGETHATNHARHKALFADAPAGWRKTETARGRMSDAQAGNTCRRGGKKVTPKPISNHESDHRSRPAPRRNPSLPVQSAKTF